MQKPLYAKHVYSFHRFSGKLDTCFLHINLSPSLATHISDWK